MRLFPGVLGLFTVVALLGCAPDASIGPRVASGLVVTDASAAKSTGVSAKVYCNGTACYAAAFEFTDFPAYTIFTATFQNLQGTYPPGGPSVTQQLNRIHFQFFDQNTGNDYIAADAAFRSFVTVGNVQAGLETQWSQDSQGDGLSAALFTVNGHGIVGCSGAAFLLDFHFQTCPSQGLDGWVKVGFKLFHAGAAPKKAPVRFKDFFFTFGNHGTRCTVGGGQPGTCTELPY